MSKVIELDQFKARKYQKPIFRALENEGYRRLVAIWPRRAGKDVAGFNLMIRQAVSKIGVYFYVFPTFSSGRRILWDAITNDGFRILDYVPAGIIESRHEQQMRIRLINGSVIQIIGSDNYDNTLVGTNPVGMVFSEYALQDPRAYQFSSPILVCNDGWALFLSTPRGKNHLYDLYKIASNNRRTWFCSRLTLDDTKHISLDLLEQEREQMSDDLIQQEYYCSFDMGVEGAYYTKYVDRMRLNNQVGNVPWEASFKVHTAWDIGIRDSTVIIFFQTIGTTVRIIDYYEKNKEGLEHYINIVKNKPYTYGRHIAPHDMAVKEFGSGMTRLQKARHLGIKFILAPNVSIMDGIEAVRSSLSKIYIDVTNCSQLIKAIENYRQEYDSKKRVYKRMPLHNEHSHACDALRYLSLSLPKTRDGMTPQDIERMRNETLYGEKQQFSQVFHNPTTVR